MASLHHVGGVLVMLVSAGAIALACSDDPDGTHYGPPSGLTGKQPTGVSGDGGAAPAPSGTGGGGNDSGGGGPGSSALCGGKGPIDGGACAVSWTKDIYPQVQSAGHWKCADAACHGKKGGGATPFIDNTSESAAYAGLVAAKLTTNAALTYFNPCSTDPAQSGFVCNTTQPSSCGSLAMPATSTPPGAALMTAAELKQVSDWVKCGSPEN